MQIALIPGEVTLVLVEVASKEMDAAVVVSMIFQNYFMTSLCQTPYFIDINECSRGTDRCSNRATCRNTVGSYTCSCNSGYRGNGRSCTGI